jgi:hypothetical protein
MQPNADLSACVPCPAGTASTDGHCTICPEGEQPTSDGRGCEACMVAVVAIGGGLTSNDSHFWSDGSQCQRCQPGYGPNAGKQAFPFKLVVLGVMGLEPL